MNRFTALLSKPVRPMIQNAFRTLSTSSHPGYTGNASFKKTWLSDASTYPIIAILSTAVTGCVSFTAYKSFHPDVRFRPGKRQALLRGGESA